MPSAGSRELGEGEKRRCEEEGGKAQVCRCAVLQVGKP